MDNQYAVPNHFVRVENLLRYRRQVLASFDSLPRNEGNVYHILRNTNILFYKAIIEEMRKLVAIYDAEFKDGGNQ